VSAVHLRRRATRNISKIINYRGNRFSARTLGIYCFRYVVRFVDYKSNIFTFTISVSYSVYGASVRNRIDDYRSFLIRFGVSRSEIYEYRDGPLLFQSAHTSGGGNYHFFSYNFRNVFILRRLFVKPSTIYRIISAIPNLVTRAFILFKALPPPNQNVIIRYKIK